MTTRTIMNNYASHTEQKLYEDLVGEFTQLWGIDCTYVPRTSESAQGFDLLFGDDPTKKYSTNYSIEVYVQSVDNFEGAELFTKFGLQVKKQARFLMPNRAFQREVQGAYSRPQEGDLIWMSNFRALFEIKKVDEEHFFYDFGKSDFYAFSLVVEKFRYNDEKIVTDNKDIDAIVNQISYVYNFQMANTGTGTYALGETVNQGQASGVVVTWNLPTGMLQLKNINGLFLPNTNVIGATSNASYELINYNILDSVNHLLSDNQGINIESNTVLNFTETNPWGEPD